MEVKEGKASKEQGEIRKGKGCLHQIFAIKMGVDEYLGKGNIIACSCHELRESIVHS